MKRIAIGISVFVIAGVVALGSITILNDSESQPSDEIKVVPTLPVSPENQDETACPDQEVYIPGLKRCVPAPLSCAPSERWDFLRERCVPDIPEPAEPVQPTYIVPLPPLPTPPSFQEPIEPAQPTFTAPLPSRPSFQEEQCQEAQVELADAVAELAIWQAKLSKCQAGSLPICTVEEHNLSWATFEAESARRHVREWCP